MRFLQNLMIILLLVASAPAFAQESTEEAENARVMKILQNLAETGGYSDERQLIDGRLEALSQEFGPEHPVLLQALSAAGRSFFQQGDYDGALRVFERQVELLKQVLGSEDPATLAAMSWLAGMLGKMGRFPQAREVEEELVEVFTRILGAEHPDTLTDGAGQDSSQERKRRKGEAILPRRSRCTGQPSKPLRLLGGFQD